MGLRYPEEKRRKYICTYLFSGERPSIFGDVAETSDDSGEDEYESVRSKREPRKKRKKDLTPGKFITQILVLHIFCLLFIYTFELQVYPKIHDILWTNFCKDSTLK